MSMDPKELHCAPAAQRERCGAAANRELGTGVALKVDRTSAHAAGDWRWNDAVDQFLSSLQHP